MIYIQLFTFNPAKGKLAEHRGHEGVIHMDTSLPLEMILQWAEQNTFPKNIIAYQVRKTSGRGCSNYREVSEIKLVS